MMRLVFFAFVFTLSQDVLSSYDCPDGYQALSDDPNLSCSNSLRIARPCSTLEPCELDRCVASCDERSDCNWFFHNSVNGCQLFNECDGQKVPTFSGRTCEKQLDNDAQPADNSDLDEVQLVEDTDEVSVEGYTGLVADCFGNAIGSRLTVNSVQECLGLCNGLDTCVGVSTRHFFDPDNFGCWLKSASCSEAVGSCNVQSGWCFFERDNEITSHEQLKSMVKTAFDTIKSPENKSALPGLIRKAFHDAGHFDKSSGDVRMGCIQHFLSGSNACPQHAHLEEAESVVNAVMDQIPSGLLSMADAVQLLGALAVDELAQDTGAPLLYDRVRTGRVDPQAEECIDNQAMCNNLPAFFTQHHSEVDHDDIVTSLNDEWVQEIEGKMMDVNSLSKQDAVALIGAHTVGRHFDFGHWTQQPNIFDNEYFVQLKRVKDWLDSENELGENAGHPFGADVRSNWWIDSETVEDPNAVFPASRIMMLDADLTLVLNAPELVEKYAADLFAWREDFDDAYIVMSELGFSTLEPPIEGGSDRRLLQRSDELLDEDFEFFQNLQIHREEQMEKIHTTFRRKM